MARYIDADKLRQVFIDGVRAYNGMCTVNDVLRNIDGEPTADVVEIPKTGIGDLSDGYHTFNELYHHRAVLFSVICNLMPDKVWKSKLHDTGDMFEGMFIVGIETPDGQATYHYDVNPYWDLFKVKELEKAPKWDGHTPTDAINRIAKVKEVKHGEWKLNKDGSGICSECGRTQKNVWDYDNSQNFCGHCGAKMDGGKAE